MQTSVCKLLRPGDTYVGRQGFTYVTGLTGETAGSQRISMTVVNLPVGARAKAHLHRGIETAVYVLDGETEMFWGDRLQECLVARAGEYVYVPADMPHLVINRSGAPCRAVVVHTAADDQEGIVLLPDLDALIPVKT